MSKLPVSSTQKKVTISKSEAYSGPLPHPDTLRQFNDILPGAAERIFNQFEKQTNHRINIETLVIKSDIRKSYLGLILAFFLCLLGMGGWIYLASIGKSIEGAAIGGTYLATLAGTFIYGTRQRKAERNRKSSF